MIIMMIVCIAEIGILFFMMDSSPSLATAVGRMESFHDAKSNDRNNIFYDGGPPIGGGFGGPPMGGGPPVGGGFGPPPPSVGDYVNNPTAYFAQNRSMNAYNGEGHDTPNVKYIGEGAEKLNRRIKRNQILSRIPIPDCISDAWSSIVDWKNNR